MAFSLRTTLSLITTFATILSAASAAQAGSAAAIALAGTYSASATETTLQFDGKVGLKSSSTPSEAEAQRQIRKQIKYLQSNFRRLKVASVRSDWKTTVTSIEAASPGLFRIYYRFSATAIITNSISNSVEVLIPVNPDTVERADRTQACVDKQEGGFYYYWNPRLAGCPMVEGSDYLRITGAFSRKANTVQTYPEYNRLFQTGAVRIAILLGKVYPTDGDDPAKGNPWSFPQIQYNLKMMGFTSQITSQAPYIEEYSLQTRRGPVVVSLFFGESDIREKNSNAFHQLYKHYLENYNIVMYGGHAGTGKNLNLSMIKDASGLSIQPNRSLYQILLMGACFPYAYYVKDYFNTKASSADPRGTKNLDIIAEGIEGGFDHSNPQMSNIIRAVVDYANGTKLTSYQQLLSSDPAFSKALMSVVGDEDNPTSADQLR